MKAVILIITLLISNLCISQTEIWTSDSEDFTNWTFEDVDNDGSDWQIDDSGNNGGFGFNGTVFFSDASGKTPNNLLKSPTFNINSSLTTLNFEMRIGNAIGAPFTQENYAVYIYDSSVNPTGNYTSATEIINTSANQTSSSEIITASIPSSFAGKNVGIIIRHYNNSGVFGNLLLVDDFKVTSPMNIPSLVLSAKVFLQGALLSNANTNIMRDDLRSLGYIPTTSPYTDTATCLASVFNSGGTNGTGITNDDIVDWIWVELRDENDNTNIIAAQSALLQKDGDIVDLDGTSELSFDIPYNNYFVAIKHRNHLAVITSSVFSLTDQLTLIDFTNTSVPITFGNNAQVIVSVTPNVLALWAGDSNGDGRLNYLGVLSEIPTVRFQVFNDPDNSFLGGPPAATYGSLGYFKTDTDMSGSTYFSGASSDILKIRDNIFNNPSNSFLGGPPSSTYTFTQQLPEGANN